LEPSLWIKSKLGTYSTATFAAALTKKVLPKNTHMVGTYIHESGNEPRVEAS